MGSRDEGKLVRRRILPYKVNQIRPGKTSLKSAICVIILLLL
jgi:hypothetical protein